MATLEQGAADKLQGAILDAAEERFADQELRVKATQHAPGDRGIGVESVIVELIANTEDELQEAVLDQAHERFVGGRGNLIAQTVQHSHDRLRSYGSGHNFDVESIIDSFSGVQVRRSGNTITIGYGWEHVAAAYFERGTSDHRIDGSPVLSFIWENPPSWVKEEFEQGRESGGQFRSGWRVFLQNVTVSGIPESRFVRSGIDWLQSEVS